GHVGTHGGLAAGVGKDRLNFRSAQGGDAVPAGHLQAEGRELRVNVVDDVHHQLVAAAQLLAGGRQRTGKGQDDANLDRLLRGGGQSANEDDKTKNSGNRPDPSAHAQHTQTPPQFV